jgi:hypothetical protein
MRIMLPHPKVHDGRTIDSDNSEANEDENDERRLLMAEAESEGEPEGEGENLLALNSGVNANHSPLFDIDQVAGSKVVEETMEENSNFLINENPNIVMEGLNSIGGVTVLEGRVIKVDGLCGMSGKGVGQEEGVGGPTLTNYPHNIVKGGVGRRLTKSEQLGRVSKPILSPMSKSEGKEKVKGGVYSDGPRVVYNTLNGDACPPCSPKNRQGVKKIKGIYSQNSVLPSASLRLQQQLLRSFKYRKSTSSSIPSVACSISDEAVCSNRQQETEVVVKRSSPNKFKADRLRAGSCSSVGDIICCSSINSSDIRNCNKNFLKKQEKEVASKVWSGAVGLGVELNAGVGINSKGHTEEECIFEIQENEKRDEIERIRRERQKPVFK